MTISNEKKEKIIELFDNGVNKKDIAKLEEVSYPTIRDILNGNNSEQKQEIKEDNKIIEKKLSEIFNYENYTEKSVLDLLFNLRRIGENYGKDLGGFVEDINFVFDKYNKYTDNPIKLLNFLLDVSENLSLIYDCIEPDKFLTMVERYNERDIFINDTETYIRNEIIPVLDGYIERKEFLKNEIILMQEKLSQITSMEAIMMVKLLENPTEEKLEKANDKIKELNVSLREIVNEGLQYKKENLDSKLEFENAKKENIVLKMIFERIMKVFPTETKSIISEIENERQ